MAVVAFITPLLLSFGLSESTVTQIVAIIMTGADVLAYIISEAWWTRRTRMLPGQLSPMTSARKAGCRVHKNNSPSPIFRGGRIFALRQKVDIISDINLAFYYRFYSYFLALKNRQK